MTNDETNVIPLRPVAASGHAACETCGSVWWEIHPTDSGIHPSAAFDLDGHMTASHFALICPCGMSTLQLPGEPA